MMKASAMLIGLVAACGLSACVGPPGPAGARGYQGQTGQTGGDTVIVTPARPVSRNVSSNGYYYYSD